jgi:hypothetical protein
MNQGVGGRVLMKKTRGKISRVSVPLCGGNLGSLSSRGGQAQFFFESAIAIPQLEGSTCAIATPQLIIEMLLRTCNSAIPQSQFFL